MYKKNFINYIKYKLYEDKEKIVNDIWKFNYNDLKFIYYDIDDWYNNKKLNKYTAKKDSHLCIIYRIKNILKNRE